MKEELNRLKTLVNQLIARLQKERETTTSLRNQLAAREAELERAKNQVQDMRRKVNNLFAQFAPPEDEKSAH